MDNSSTSLAIHAINPTNPCVILLAHGSRNANSNTVHFNLVRDLDAQHDNLNIAAAFLEQAEPTATDVIRELVARGASNVQIAPYFLLPGNHTTRDIPELVATLQNQFPHVAIDQLDAFGQSPSAVAAVSLYLADSQPKDRNAAT